jgi:hypothetical protein
MAPGVARKSTPRENPAIDLLRILSFREIQPGIVWYKNLRDLARR